MLFEYYDPHPHVCKMAQYKCCKNYTSCPLYHTCSQMNISEHKNICQQDCPNCSYFGCSLSVEQRIKNPIYLNHVVQGEMLDLNIENRIFAERKKQKTNYNKRRYELLFLFSDEFKQSKADYREKNREILRERCKIAYRKRVGPPKPRPKKYDLTPPCNYACFNCPYDDCIVEGTENEIYRKLYMKKYRTENAEILKEKRAVYKENHRVEARQKERERYYSNREQLMEQQRRYREIHRDELRIKEQLTRIYKKKIIKGEVEPMPIKTGKYDDILLARTQIEELIEHQNKQGTLFVYKNNIVVFEIDEKRFPLLILSSLGDFSVPSSEELWLGTDKGEILFKRKYANPLWEFEKDKK